ncbi:MAG: DNA/RNA nuclease SfsA [Clostridia bacterium]|nr:DNA/RNA nuclease SfsA [Clostridia bacterium]
MKYKKIIDGVFLARPNRFIARVLVDGKEEVVHVKNTGRCRELLVDNAKVYLSVSDNPARKTKYDLVAVEKVTDRGVLMINMDSQIPNDAVAEWLPVSGFFSENAAFRREYTYGKSRFDFFVQDNDRKAFIEVKGVTLENDGVVSFPDAPTERGIKHVEELISACENGYESYIVFVVQMKGVTEFRPNAQRHPQFAQVLRKAQSSGVKIIAVDCIVTPDEMKIDAQIKVNLL